MRDFTYFKNDIFSHFMGVQASGYNVTDHPDFDPRGPVFYIYDKAVMNVSTGAYIEVELVLEAIFLDHVVGKNFREHSDFRKYMNFY